MNSGQSVGGQPTSSKSHSLLVHIKEQMARFAGMDEPTREYG
jgi:hypothetical protein